MLLFPSQCSEPHSATGETLFIIVSLGTLAEPILLFPFLHNFFTGDGGARFIMVNLNSLKGEGLEEASEMWLGHFREPFERRLCLSESGGDRIFLFRISERSDRWRETLPPPPFVVVPVPQTLPPARTSEELADAWQDRQACLLRWKLGY